MNRTSPSEEEMLSLYRNTIRTFFFVAIFYAGMLPGVLKDASGDELKLIPSFAVKEEYSDNILYTTSEVQRDFISTFSPGLTFIDRTEKMDITVSGRLDRRLYSRYGELDATDQYYEGTGKYAFTPRFNLSGKALYSDDSRPDRDFETTGLSLTGVTRRRQNYGISGDYALSEKALTTFSYDYLNDAYDSNRYIDSEAHRMNLGFIHDLNYFAKSTKGRANLGYAKYNTINSKVDNYEATIGISRDLNEKWNLLIDGGARYTNSKFKVSSLEGTIFDPITPPFFFPVYTEREESSRGWGAVGQLSLTYKGERSSGSISAIHNIFPPSGQTGAVERTSFVFNASRRFAYELYGTLSGGYYFNKASEGEFSTQKTDEETIGITPGIRYEWNKDTSIETSYTYNRTRYNVTRTDAERNLFQVRFRIQCDLFN